MAGRTHPARDIGSSAARAQHVRPFAGRRVGVIRPRDPTCKGCQPVRQAEGSAVSRRKPLIEPVAFTCQFCSDRQEWDTREAADAAAVWHLFEVHPLRWRAIARGPVPHGSPADAAEPPADTHRIRLNKERRRLAHAVLYSSPVTSDAATDRVLAPARRPSVRR